MKKLTAMPAQTIPSSRQRGLSLVELMISITIGLLLLTGIAMLIVQQSSARSELEKSSRQIENGRYAMDILRNDIEHAGFFSDYSPPGTSVYTRPNPCDFTDNTANLGTTGNLGWINNAFTTPTVAVPIDGYPGNAADPTPTGCLDNYKANTAVLVIRRTSSTAVAAPGVAGTTYFQVSHCSTDTAPFVLGTSGFNRRQRDCAALATLRAYIVRIYYVSTCDVCGTDTIPTLKAVENGDTANPIPLVEGIDDMQFDYGIDTTNDGSADTYTTAPAAADWPNVMTVRVNLLARNNEPSAGYVDTKAYALGAVSAPAANDSFKRHVFSELVRAINPSGRRAP